MPLCVRRWGITSCYSACCISWTRRAGGHSTTVLTPYNYESPCESYRKAISTSRDTFSACKAFWSPTSGRTIWSQCKLGQLLIYINLSANPTGNWKPRYYLKKGYFPDDIVFFRGCFKKWNFSIVLWVAAETVRGDGGRRGWESGEMKGRPNARASEAAFSAGDIP
jgi:hypothetical protein